MPLIEVTLAKGLLTAKARLLLTDALTASVLKAEGVPDTPRARALSWVFVSEVPGARSSAKPRVCVRITVPNWSLSPARRRRVGRDVHRAVSKTFGRPLSHEECWVIIHEIPVGNWNAGGTDLTVEGLRAHVGLRLPRKPEQRAL